MEVLIAYYSSNYERFIRATVYQDKELGSLIKLMLGFFVSSLAARYMHQFNVRLVLPTGLSTEISAMPMLQECGAEYTMADSTPSV